MAIRCKGIFIIGAKRTPFCSYGGPLRELPASHAFAAAAKDAIRSVDLDPTLIDNTVVGNVNYLSQCDGGKTPRYCGLYSGVPINRPALGVNKACGTGLQAIITGAMDILIGSSQICLTGGTEVMSSLPLLVRNVRFGTALGSSYQVEDHIQKQLLDSNAGVSLPRIAEDLARRYGIQREQVDEYTLQSRLRWKAAQESNVFHDELTTLTVKIKKEEVVVDKDLPQEMSAEQLGQLPALFDDGAVVTIGNSSEPADGAATLLLASEEAIKNYGLKPLARIVSWASVGVDPVDSGIGASSATKRLLDNQGLRVDDVDLFEINETFASQVLVTAKELKIDLRNVNVNGGALAIGHPVAATGARMAGHLVYELSRRNAKRAVAASSCGGGQGVAIMLEKI